MDAEGKVIGGEIVPSAEAEDEVDDWEEEVVVEGHQCYHQWTSTERDQTSRCGAHGATELDIRRMRVLQRRIVQGRI